MELHQSLKPILKKIDFVEKYGFLSKEFGNKNTTFENYDNDKVMSIIENYGYAVKFKRSENVFKIVEKIDDFEFQFNIKLKYGICEFIWGLTKNGERLSLGGPWGLISRLISDNSNRYPLPCFSNYDELNIILGSAFEIYEDFKKELLLQDTEV